MEDDQILTFFIDKKGFFRKKYFIYDKFGDLAYQFRLKFHRSKFSLQLDGKTLFHGKKKLALTHKFVIFEHKKVVAKVRAKKHKSNYDFFIEWDLGDHKIQHNRKGDFTVFDGNDDIGKVSFYRKKKTKRLVIALLASEPIEELLTIIMLIEYMFRYKKTNG